MTYTKIAKQVVGGLCITAGLCLIWLYVVGFRLSVVQTGSMTPAIPKGSLVLIEPTKVLDSDSVGVYVNDVEQTIIHRLLYTSPNDLYVFKGDANTLVDAAVNKQQIIGAAKWSVPYIGYVAMFTKSWTGIVLFVYIPAIAMIAYEINKLAYRLSTARDKSFRRSEYLSKP